LKKTEENDSKYSFYALLAVLGGAFQKALKVVPTGLSSNFFELEYLVFEDI